MLKDLERLAQDSIWVKSFDDADGVEGTHRIGVGAVAIMMRSMQGTGAKCAGTVLQVHFE